MPSQTDFSTTTLSLMELKLERALDRQQSICLRPVLINFWSRKQTWNKRDQWKDFIPFTNSLRITRSDGLRDWIQHKGKGISASLIRRFGGGLIDEYCNSHLRLEEGYDLLFRVRTAKSANQSRIRH